MGALLVAIASVACFAMVIVRTRIVAVAQEISGTSAAGVSAMLDAELDDDAKERAVRNAGLGLLKLSWQVGWRIVVALASVALPIFVAGFAGWVPQEESFAVLLRVDFIVAVSLAAIGLGYALRRRGDAVQVADKITDASSYGGGDRLLHAVAFSGPGTLKTLARLDDTVFARRIASNMQAPPIFVTSLARGGTTALLNALHDMPGIATHRYADMPFLSAPVLWSRLSGSRRHLVERERSHGDGLKIGLKSPEAFDEVFWMLHWPEKYCETQIDLWRGADFKAEAQVFFTRHFAKIAHIRHPESKTAVRYLSKNNANIARLSLLPVIFPGCQIIVPLREPSAHAASLHRQHQNFCRLHAEDPFSRRYMRDIGHLEFGDLHRPLAFNIEFLEGRDRQHPDYWLAYWITCFESVAENASHLLFVRQDDLRKAPGATMDNLIKRLGLSDKPAKPWNSYFRPGADTRKDDLFDAALLARARTVYHQLGELSQL